MCRVNVLSTEFREFRTLDELFRYIDSQIEDLRKKLGDLLRLVEEARLRAEQERKLKSALSRILGSSIETSSPVVELKNIKIYVNPSAENEISLFEQLAEAINTKIMQLQAIRKDLEVFRDLNLTTPLRVVIIDGVPRSIMIKL